MPLGYTISSLKPSVVSLPVSSPETIAAKYAGKNKNLYKFCLQAASSGFLSDYNESSCGTGVVSAGVGSQLEAVGIRAGLSAVPVVGNALAALSGFFTGGHQKAVAREQQTLCAAVPQANAFLRQIDSFVQTGQLDYSTAARALDQGFQRWRATVGPILKDTGGKCNAACFYENGFRAAIEARKQAYAAAAAQLTRGGNNLQAPSVDAASKFYPSLSVDVPGEPIAVPSQFVTPSTPGPRLTASPFAQVSDAFASGPTLLQRSGVSQSSLSTAVLVGGALLVAFIFFGRK